MFPQTIKIRGSLTLPHLVDRPREKLNVWKPFIYKLFSFLFLNLWHQCDALNMAWAAWIDVLGYVFEPCVYGNMSVDIWHFPRKQTFMETCNAH